METAKMECWMDRVDDALAKHQLLYLFFLPILIIMLVVTDDESTS